LRKYSLLSKVNEEEVTGITLKSEKQTQRSKHLNQCTKPHSNSNLSSTDTMKLKFSGHVGCINDVWRGEFQRREMSNFENLNGCSNAVELSSNNHQIYSFFSRLKIQDPSKSKPYQLKYVNAGAGTTGTRSIHQLFCNKWKVKSLHFSIECNANKSLENGMIGNKLLIWYNHMTKCAVNPQHQCQSRDILQSLETRLPLILSEYEFLSDTPVDSLFLEIFAIMKFQVRS
jgi:hypothetical protein